MSPSISVAEIFNAWLARAGDTYLSSLLNTFLYAAAFIAAYRRWQTLRQIKTPWREQTFWITVLLILLFMGLNKQLDFQVLLIEIGKPIAIKGGWYESRRMVQAAFAFFIMGLSGLFAGMIIYLIMQHWRYYILALLGLAIICLYVIMEAAWQSHVAFGFDSSEKWGIRLTDLIEMGGILLIIANALKRPGKNER